MAWLLTHMWVALAGVGLFSLLFGWSMRGIMLVGKLRTARVDRDIARTELEQAKAEIEGLYAAQRNTAPGSVAPATIADPALRAELNVREKRLSELSAELSRSKAELQSLKSGAGRGAAPVAPKMASDQTEPSLLWRNRHLESRVQHLETALHEQASAPVQAVAAPAVAAAAVASAAPAVDQAELDKLKWQADFFKQRVETLEAELAAQPAPAAVPVAAQIESDDAGEELARLRWRNRFLEGRLAYFEGDAAPEDVATSEVAELVDLDVEEVEADETLEDDEEVMSATDAILQELEEADAAADAEEEDEYVEESDEDDAADELEDDLDIEDDGDDQEDEDLEDDALEDDDEEDALDEDEDLELEDDADVDEDDDEAEADEEADEADEDEDADDEDLDAEDEDDLESDDEEDEDALEDDESDEDDSEDDESDENDEDDEVEEDDAEDDDSDEDDADESDDEEDFDEDDEEVDEDALDEADEDDDGETDEESDDDADEELEDADGEDDAEAYEDADEDEIPAERPIALPKAVAGAPDDLTIIGGIGPKIQEVLNELGIFHYDQIAAWSPANIAWVDNHLNFSGRIAREGWVEQAAILSGDVAEE